MKELKFTLIADGSSDKILLRIIKWSLDSNYPRLPNEGKFADFRSLPKPPGNLKEKVEASVRYFPFDVIFIHRDAEKTDMNMVKKRVAEIEKALNQKQFEKTICIIPVKMMESWLLFDSEAIRKASGNRNFRGKIELPPIKRTEKESKPKELLHKLLEEASGLRGRNLKRLNIDKAVHLVAENIDDFSPLRNLKAFNCFEHDIKAKIDKLLTENGTQAIPAAGN